MSIRRETSKSHLKCKFLHVSFLGTGKAVTNLGGIQSSNSGLVGDGLSEPAFGRSDGALVDPILRGGLHLERVRHLDHDGLSEEGAVAEE